MSFKKGRQQNYHDHNNIPTVENKLVIYILRAFTQGREECESSQNSKCEIKWIQIKISW